MSTHLNLEDQEQLDRLRHFWRQYGTPITAGLVIVLAVVAGWQGWQWWQRDQAIKASALFDQLEAAVTANDKARVAQAFTDLTERHPRTAFAQQGALIAARAKADAGQVDDAAAALQWAVAHAVEDEYRTVARLRLAGILIEQKKFDEALTQLDAATAPTFKGLVLDRRGDVFAAMGRADDARKAWTEAHAALDPQLDLRRLVEAKLAAVGAPPPADAPAAAAGSSGAAR